MDDFKPLETGGSAAGYARWEGWINRGGLAEYARRRNNALQVQGVSRMSAYLNLGMVSPSRLTRDAVARAGGGGGCQKYLDEFHTWRELSYGHCFHAPETHRTVRGLPQWAQATLRRHAGDARAKHVTLENLAAGKSGHDVWDAMQECLIQRGELHNNARMTWGKQLLGRGLHSSNVQLNIRRFSHTF